MQEMLGGRYKLLNELGRGGTAVVWRARDEVLGRSVAVKVLASRYANDPHSRTRIRDEARAAAALSPHPHIAQVYDFGEFGADGTPLPYVVMEFVNGPTLQQRVALGPLPPRTVFRIGSEVASAVAAAHADGLVHRDIKLANVMVTPSGAKVVDFGLAAVAGPATPEEVLLGTPAYLAPERLLGDAVEPASDVYALGVLLYRLLAGESPWTVDTTTQMLSAHVYIEPTPMPVLPAVPPAVTDLVHRCLRKDPAGRPTAAEAALILADAAEAEVRDEEDVRGEAGKAVVRWAAVPTARDGDDRPAAGDDRLPVPVVVPAAPLAGWLRRRRRVVLFTGGVVVTVVVIVLLYGLLLPGGAGRVPVGGAGGTPSGAPAPSATGTDTTASAQRPSAPAAVGTPIPAASRPPAGPLVPAGGAATPSRTGAAGPTASPTGGTPATSWPAVRIKTLYSSAGSVEARCGRRGRAFLMSWTAYPPYVVIRVDPGPAYTTFIVFATAGSRVRMTVTCVGGEPTAAIG